MKNPHEGYPQVVTYFNQVVRTAMMYGVHDIKAMFTRTGLNQNIFYRAAAGKGDISKRTAEKVIRTIVDATRPVGASG